MNQIVIGLAGHIDHGKTSVVKALTGVNTDRLEEEIRRGMTIDIGFAFLTERVTLIDVPGHEKFVKNMMAGVSAVDAALLIIAADDGVMPQTREHFDILTLLGVQNGVIALNKIDLVDEEWLELVEADIQEMVAGSFLEKAPVIRVSAEKNTGFDLLKTVLIDMCSEIQPKTDRGIFRLWVDRVFTIKGFGTVVTGTVSSGSIKTGELLELLPGGKKVKIRGLQTHSKAVGEVTLGDRAAINLQGIEKDELSRGFQLSTPGYFSTTTRIGVRLSLLQTAIKEVRQNQRLRIHAGTQEVMARVSLINQKLLEPGSAAPAILRLESPLITSKDDRFILRSYSPVITIGGGIVLDVQVSEKWKKARQDILTLYAASDHRRVELILENDPYSPVTDAQLKIRLGLADDRILSLISANKNLIRIEYHGSKWVVTKLQLEKVRQAILDFMALHHKSNRRRAGVTKEEIRQNFQGDARFFDYLLKEMEDSGQIKREGEIISLPGHSIQLSPSEQDTTRKLLNILDAEGFSSSSLEDLAQACAKPVKEVKQLLDIAEQRKQVLRLEGNLIFTRKNFENLKLMVEAHFEHSPELSVGEFKDLASTSRKYAVPLLEYFDKLKITYRSGNTRKRVP
ncbi:MAG: selenocysteine-specific translation elongation factor [FCB group bacterium]|nr:selenocysteine-specific translation elongation factor [FCB group bacterium]